MQLVGLPPRDWTHALGTESRVLTNGQTGNSGPWIFLFNLNFLDPTLSRIYLSIYLLLGASETPPVVKNMPAKAGEERDMGLIPGSGRSPGEGKGNPLQYSCLENPMDRGPVGLQSTGSQRVGHDRAYLLLHAWDRYERLHKNFKQLLTVCGVEGTMIACQMPSEWWGGGVRGLTVYPFIPFEFWKKEIYYLF